MRWFLLLAMICVATPALAGGGSAQPLRVLSQCPETEPTCVMFDGYFVGAGDINYDVKTHPNFVTMNIPEGSDFGTVTLRVKGSLNGADIAEYEIVLDYPADLLNCRDVQAPIVGVSSNSSATLVTDLGKLKLSDAGIEFGSRDSLIVVNERTKVSEAFLVPGWERYSWDGEAIFTFDGGVLWRVRGQCLNLQTDGLFERQNVDACRGGRLEQAAEADIAEVRGAQLSSSQQKKDRLIYDLWRLVGTPYLVNIYGVACT